MTYLSISPFFSFSNADHFDDVKPKKKPNGTLATTQYLNLRVEKFKALKNIGSPFSNYIYLMIIDYASSPFAFNFNARELTLGSSVKAGCAAASHETGLTCFYRGRGGKSKIVTIGKERGQDPVAYECERTSVSHFAVDGDRALFYSPSNRESWHVYTLQSHKCTYKHSYSFGSKYAFTEAHSEQRISAWNCHAGALMLGTNNGLVLVANEKEQGEIRHNENESVIFLGLHRNNNHLFVVTSKMTIVYDVSTSQPLVSASQPFSSANMNSDRTCLFATVFLGNKLRCAWMDENLNQFIFDLPGEQGLAVSADRVTLAAISLDFKPMTYFVSFFDLVHCIPISSCVLYHPMILSSLTTCAVSDTGRLIIHSPEVKSKDTPPHYSGTLVFDADLR